MDHKATQVPRVFCKVNMQDLLHTKQKERDSGLASGRRQSEKLLAFRENGMIMGL